MAAGSAGLHIVDLSNPLAPALLQTVGLLNGATRVEVYEGRAYVASSNQVARVDLSSGELLQDMFGPLLSLAELSEFFKVSG